VNYGVDLKKNPLAGETGVREFSKPENRGGDLTPTGLALLYLSNSLWRLILTKLSCFCLQVSSKYSYG
jgi:hypothetical protein